MGFDACNKLMKNIFVDLRKDGVQTILVLIGEPEPRTDKYKGKLRTRACFPVLSEEGYKVWAVGSRLFRSIRDDFKRLKGKPLLVTRHGGRGDTDTTYEIEVVKGFAKLVTAAKKPDKMKVKTMMLKAVGDNDQDEE